MVKKVDIYEKDSRVVRICEGEAHGKVTVEVLEAGGEFEKGDTYQTERRTLEEDYEHHILTEGQVEQDY